jgi:hypothetical protein
MLIYFELRNLAPSFEKGVVGWILWKNPPYSLFYKGGSDYFVIQSNI